MSELGVLDGKTVGVVEGDFGINTANDPLVDQLTKLGHEPAEVVSLPCAQTSTSCEQYDTAAQKLKDANVDFVFMTLPSTTGPDLIQAASNIAYRPDWVFLGSETTPTVLKFYESVMNDIDGSVGMGYSFTGDSPSGTECNRIVAERSGESYAPDSSAYSFTTLICNQFRFLDEAGDAIGQGELNQGALIASLEELGTIKLGSSPDGSLSATKHDGLDYMYLCDIDSSSGTCVRRAGDPIRIAE
jgi:hypothetical protein